MAHATGNASGTTHEQLFWRSGTSASALVDGWKLTVSDPPGRTWLFDMANDPHENRDLSEARPEKVALIRAAMDAHNAEQQPPSWPSGGAMPIPIDNDITVPESETDEFIYWSN